MIAGIVGRNVSLKFENSAGYNQVPFEGVSIKEKSAKKFSVGPITYETAEEKLEEVPLPIASKSFKY